MSLDLLIEQTVAHEAAREALLAALKLAPLGGLLIRYLGLFRPAQRELSFDRVSTLLNELLPEITAQEFARDGVTYIAPIERWQWGLQQVFDAHERGKLRLPLNGHGFLREVMTAWVPASIYTAAGRMESASATGHIVRKTAPAAASKTRSMIDSLAARARGE